MARRGSRGPGSNPETYARQPLSVGLCGPCGKKTYLSRKAAKAIAKRANKADPGTAYRCPENLDQWHVGHLPPEIRNGTR